MYYTWWVAVAYIRGAIDTLVERSREKKQRGIFQLLEDDATTLQSLCQTRSLTPTPVGRRAGQTACHAGCSAARYKRCGCTLHCQLPPCTAHVPCITKQRCLDTLASLSPSAALRPRPTGCKAAVCAELARAALRAPLILLLWAAGNVTWLAGVNRLLPSYSLSLHHCAPELP
jgi:hypothetical protein